MDSMVKIWDMRSDYSLFAMNNHTDKIFGLEWFGNETLLSGGADQKLVQHEFNQQNQ